ncbi:MAG: hypothetical protein AB8B71_03160 [Paracoccaceae bacterium]
MTSFIRPEARDTLWRWREVLVGAALIVMGSWWIVGPGQLMGLVGGGAALVGAGLAYVGTQRARFRGRQGGVGSVDVDEGQIIYFGPLTGGAMALRDMTELALLRSSVTTHWRLSSKEERLFIPIDADGADVLFDAFTTLPGLNVQRMLGHLNDETPHDTVIWSRGFVRPPQDWLH